MRLQKSNRQTVNKKLIYCKKRNVVLQTFSGISFFSSAFSSFASVFGTLLDDATEDGASISTVDLPPSAAADVKSLATKKVDYNELCKILERKLTKVKISVQLHS